MWVLWVQAGSPNLLAQPKSTRPKSQSAQERPADPPSGYSKGIRPKNQPTHERPVNPPPRCPGASHPECPSASHPRRLLTQVFSLPISNSTKRSCQPALYVISVGYPMNRPPCLRHNRKTLLAIALSGRQLCKMNNKSSFLK